MFPLLITIFGVSLTWLNGWKSAGNLCSACMARWRLRNLWKRENTLIACDSCNDDSVCGRMGLYRDSRWRSLWRVSISSLKSVAIAYYKRILIWVTHFDLSSRVKLAVNRETQQAIAVKIIDLEKAADCYDNVRKEVGDKKIGSYKEGSNWCTIIFTNNVLLFL